MTATAVAVTLVTAGVVTALAAVVRAVRRGVDRAFWGGLAAANVLMAAACALLAAAGAPLWLWLVAAWGIAVALVVVWLEVRETRARNRSGGTGGAEHAEGERVGGRRA